MSRRYDGYVLHTGNKNHGNSANGDIIYLAKRWGQLNGYSGGLGGWIYNSKGRHVAHGWSQFAKTFGNAARQWAMRHTELRDVSDKELAAAMKGKKVNELIDQLLQGW